MLRFNRLTAQSFSRVSGRYFSAAEKAGDKVAQPKAAVVPAPAAPAPSSGKHDPPKKIHGRTGRYAMAAYTAASKANLLDKVESELSAFVETIKKNPKFEQYLENPTIPRNEKTTKISALLDDKQFSHITRNLFTVLGANGRLGETSKVIRDYHELLQASRGSVDVTIISAQPLQKEQLANITKAVNKIVGDKKTVEVKQQVEPSILGGLQLLVGDRFLDLSVVSRVNELGKTLDSSV